MSTDYAARRGALELSTGVRLHYTEAGSPDGEAVLCLHGYTDSSFSFSRIMPLLPPVFRTIAPDQRGHGDSDCPPSGYTLTEFAADAAAVLDALGIAHATVIGHSMGSLVAQRFALDHPHRVARLVLVGSATTAANEGVLALRSDVEAVSDPVPAAFVREFQQSMVHVPLPPAFLDTVVAESRKLPARVWRAVLDGILTFDSAAELRTLRCPTLIVWGDRDSAFPRDEQYRLRDGIAGARLTIYSETGHSPQWERPAQFVRDVLAFIASAPGD
jgi:pimeloyl-ACP methyl ester carboxylesterase